MFSQAENDYDLSQSRTLSQEMKQVGKVSELTRYSSYGKNCPEGHSLAHRDSSVWGDDAFRFREQQ
jgi:hypothetical protein